METPTTTPVARIHELEAELSALETELSMRESELTDLAERYGELRDAVMVVLGLTVETSTSPFGYGTAAWHAWLVAMPLGAIDGMRLEAALCELATCYTGD